MSDLVLHLDGFEVPVEWVGANRKARLTVEADGSLCLRAAGDIGVDELQAFLLSKRMWVYQKLSEKESLQASESLKRLVNGEGFSYLGRNYRLRLGSGDAVRVERGRLVLPTTRVAQGEAALIAWYGTRGETWVKPRVRSWAERLRVGPTAVEVGDIGRKWGSASAVGRVRLHWAVFQLRPALVDYVVAHEVTHLAEPHHGPAFWKLLARSMPDARERKAELARVGARLWLGGIERPPTIVGSDSAIAS